MELKNYILSKINPRTYYASRVGGEVGNFVCPFHKDSNPSLQIRDDGSAFCYGCRKKWKNIVDFEQAFNKCTLQKALFSLHNDFVDPIVSKSKYLSFYQELSPPSKAYKWLVNRGIGASTIQRFLLGYDKLNNKITLPIFNEWGYCVNIRLFRYEDDSPWKVISFRKNYGKPRLFPFSSLYHKEVFIFEGEMDTLLAIHLGLNAVTSTGGAQSFRKEFVPYFKDKIVYVCMDNDEAGIAGAKNVIKLLSGVALKLYNIIIPPKYGKDFTDYIKHRPIEAFLRIVDQTTTIVKPISVDYNRVREIEEFSQEETMITELKPGKNILHLILRILPGD